MGELVWPRFVTVMLIVRNMDWFAAGARILGAYIFPTCFKFIMFTGKIIILLGSCKEKVKQK